MVDVTVTEVVVQDEVYDIVTVPAAGLVFSLSEPWLTDDSTIIMSKSKKQDMAAATLPVRSLYLLAIYSNISFSISSSITALPIEIAYSPAP